MTLRESELDQGRGASTGSKFLNGGARFSSILFLMI